MNPTEPFDPKATKTMPPSGPAATTAHAAAAAGEQTTAPEPDDLRTDVHIPEGPRTARPVPVIAGRYQLLNQIGEGGMGAVWVAEQTEPVKRKVAVKLIRAERSSSATILARFEAERQAIALMDHPYIARLFDAGTEGGAPFFVMELVDGVPLTEYCDRHKLPIHERLTLFMQICQAVQHAHQKGIIHRDLKPSNVLVKSHDGKPVPKVIDFGLAKATSGMQLTERTLDTGFGAVMGTPLYMAPEQAGGDPHDIDTRADIYALGVILYELLTGTTPIEKARLRKATWDEVVRIIREEESPTPSSRISMHEGTASSAAVRGMEPAKLGRFVKGDLDWIVMKALSKDRDRRYETANGFAKDVERFLNHEPVVAGPPSIGYKLRKFVRRNRELVVATILIFLVLVAGVIGTTIGLLEAQKQEGIARNESEAKGTALLNEEQQRVKAEYAYDKTADVLDVMVSGITGDSLATQKVITPEQKIFLTIVLSYYREFATAQGDDERTRARIARAANRVGIIEDRLSRHEESAVALRAACDGFAKLAADFPAASEYHKEQADAHNNLAINLNYLGDRTGAAREYNRALNIRLKLSTDFPAVPDYQLSVSAVHNNLGLLYDDLGRRQEADSEYRKALAILERLVLDYPTVTEYRSRLADSYNNLGSLLDDDGKPEEAEGLLQKALTAYEWLSAQQMDTPLYQVKQADCHTNLGVLHARLENPAKAEAHFLKALTIQEKLVITYPAVPEHYLDLAGSRGNISMLYASLGRQAEAEATCQLALPIMEKLVADFPAVPRYRVRLADNYTLYGNLKSNGKNPADCLPWFEKGILLLQPIHQDKNHSADARRGLREVYLARAKVLDLLHKDTEAIADWSRAIEFSSPEDQAQIRASRVMSKLKVGQVIEAIAELAELTNSGGWNAGQLYDFAHVYAVACAKIADKKQEYADRAMELLDQAVKAGYKDAAHMKQDADLAPLRGRADFQKLLTNLAAKFPPSPEPAPPPRERK